MWSLILQLIISFTFPHKQSFKIKESFLKYNDRFLKKIVKFSSQFKLFPEICAFLYLNKFEFLIKEVEKIRFFFWNSRKTEKPPNSTNDSIELCVFTSYGPIYIINLYICIRSFRKCFKHNRSYYLNESWLLLSITHTQW